MGAEGSGWWGKTVGGGEKQCVPNIMISRLTQFQKPGVTLKIMAT